MEETKQEQVAEVQETAVEETVAETEETVDPQLEEL